MPLAYEAKLREGQLPSLSSGNQSIASLGAAYNPVESHPVVARVRAKIASVAAWYDPFRSMSAISGFDGQSLDPTAIKQQMRRNFNLDLDAAELGALIMLFDKDGNGKLDSAEFLHEFFKIGKSERNRLRMSRKAYQLRRTRMAEDLAEEKRRRRVAQVEIKLCPFDQADFDHAMDKVAKVASTFNPNALGSGLESFLNGKAMSPTVFRNQVWRNFGLKFTAPELSAVFNFFDKDQGGTIDAAEFMTQFFEIGHKERRKALIKKRRENERMRRKREKLKTDIEEKFGKLTNARVDHDWTQEDQNRAVDKIRTVARFYDPHRDISLAGISDHAAMDATTFKLQLRALFGINLTPAELGGLIAYFDTNGDETVDGAEFLSVFFQEARKERGMLTQRQREHDARVRAKRERFSKAHRERFASMVEAKVVWPKLAGSPLVQPSAQSPKPRRKITAKTARSMGNLSADTLDFLQHLDDQERDISLMGTLDADGVPVGFGASAGSGSAVDQAAEDFGEGGDHFEEDGAFPALDEREEDALAAEQEQEEDEAE